MSTPPGPGVPPGVASGSPDGVPVPTPPLGPPPPPARLFAPMLAFWTSTTIGLVGGLLRVKVMALVIGAGGFGVTSQLSNIVTLAAGLAALGLSTAGVALIAQATADPERHPIRERVSFVFWAPVLPSVVLLVPAALLSRQLSSLLLGSADHAAYIVVALLAVPLSLGASAVQVVLQGQGRITRLAATSSLSAVAATVVGVLAVLLFGLNGAVASFPLSALVTLLVVMVRERRLVGMIGVPRRPESTALRLFATMGGASVVATAATVGTDTVLRTDVVHRLGLDVNGTYQPAFVLSTVIFAQLCGALYGVLFPALAADVASGHRASVEETLQRGVRLGVVAVTALVLAVLATGSLLVHVFFAREFVSATPVLTTQVLGELPRMFGYAAGAAMLPSGMVRAWLGTGLAATASRLVSGMLLLPAIGLFALAWSYVIEWSLVAALSYLIAVRVQRLDLGRDNLVLVAAAAATCAATYSLVRWQPHWIGPLAAAVVTVGWVAVVPTRAERTRLVQLVRTRGRG